MKFLIIGDLHGNMPNIYYKNFDAIIAPGDFCGDKGIREAYQVSYKEFLKDRHKFREWWEIVGKKKAEKMIKRSISEGRRIMTYLDSFGVPVYYIPGNWDDWRIESRMGLNFKNEDFFKTYVTKSLKNSFSLHKKIKNIGDYNIIGYGYCNGPELLKYRNYKGIKKIDIEKNKMRYNKLLKKYNGLFKKAKKPIIFLGHNVPYNTPIDMITNKKSLRYGYHYGSLLAREMIDKYQPLVFIGAHMHEHFRSCKIGKTTAINSGFGSYVNVFLELEGNKIKKLEFYRGKEEKHSY